MIRNVSEGIKMQTREAASDESSDEINRQAKGKQQPAATDNGRGRSQRKSFTVDFKGKTLELLDAISKSKTRKK